MSYDNKCLHTMPVVFSGYPLISHGRLRGSQAGPYELSLNVTSLIYVQSVKCVSKVTLVCLM
jgi:hypothetical protein